MTDEERQFKQAENLDYYLWYESMLDFARDLSKSAEKRLARKYVKMCQRQLDYVANKLSLPKVRLNRKNIRILVWGVAKFSPPNVGSFAATTWKITRNWDYVALSENNYKKIHEKAYNDDIKYMKEGMEYILNKLA